MNRNWIGIEYSSRDTVVTKQIRRDTAIPQIHGSSATNTVVTKQEQYAVEGEGVEVGDDILLVADCGSKVCQSQFAVRMSTMLL